MENESLTHYMRVAVSLAERIARGGAAGGGEALRPLQALAGV